MIASSTAITAAITALATGTVFVQKGEVHYTKPMAGSTIKVPHLLDPKHKHYKPYPEPATVQWQANTLKALHPGDSLQNGDIIETKERSYAKLLIQDESIVNNAGNDLRS